MLDKTLKDLNRRELTFNRSEITSALPEHMTTEYPQLIELFEAYYRYLDSDEDSFGNITKSLSTTRDIYQTDASNLTYIEDELLLGENYIEGILDKRSGAELSNNFYRSKGTKFSIERFFRSFFDQDAEVSYGKDLVFTIGESQIGTFGDFIQNDKLYQYWAIQIKSAIDSSKWLDLYKLFVHPGGMYIQSAVGISSVASNVTALNLQGFAYVNDQDVAPQSFVQLGELGLQGYNEILALIEYAARDNSGVSGQVLRLRPDTMQFADWYNPGESVADSDYGTIAYASQRYNTMIGMSDVTTFTVDQDSDVGILASTLNGRETVDQDTYNYYDSA